MKMRDENTSLFRLFRMFLLGIVAMGLTAPAAAQFSDSYNFLKAVKDRDGTEATKYLNQPGSVLINTKDRTTGETGLHITTARRDLTWMGFLLQKGANPNVSDKEGVTPLMLATQLRFVSGVELLLSKNAKIDEANRRGETPLIVAVQLRDMDMVRLLLKNDANPDLTDTLAGLSARDYASRDRRAAAILAEIEQADNKAQTQNADRLFGPQG